MGIYDKVKMLAKARGLSIAKLEQMAGVANGTVGKWRTSTPYLNTLRKIADALEVNIEDLI